VVSVSTALESEAGAARILHVLATADERLTAPEVAAVLDVTPDAARKALLSLARSDLAVRRPRPTNPRAYEYAVAPREVADAE
jgi:predicted ArsR family transcriptional regulator